jgi:hypothetical protein
VTLFQFGLDVSPGPPEGDLRALFDRCDDVAVEYDAPTGRARIRFDRIAPSMVDAVVSGVRDLDHAGLVASGVVADDDLVTATGVAARLGRTRQAADRLLHGDPPPGGWPGAEVWDEARAPARGPRWAWMCAGEPLYRWSEVSAWLRAHGHTEPVEPPVRRDAGQAAGPAADADPVFEAVNLALRLRALAARIDRMALIRSLIAG